MLDWALYKKIAGVALEVGRALDQRRPPYVDMGDGRVLICSSRFNVPHIELDLQDRLVVHKPPGWEVDTKILGNAKGNRLSHFFMSVEALPLARDVVHQHGFLQRLDMPSSGLILVAKTYEAFYGLRVQLDGGLLIRDYVVLCHGLMLPDCVEVDARVYVRHYGNSPSTVCRKGKPSATRLRVLAHCYCGYRPSIEGDDLNNLFAIRIRTGRCHQIRTHMLHTGHPTVCDGKYTVGASIDRDSAGCERNLTHAHNLAFANRVPRTSKALAPLSGDLLEALRGSAPSPAAASRAPREWLAGRQGAFRDSMELSAIITARGKDHQPQRALTQLPQSMQQRGILADVVLCKLLQEALGRLRPVVLTSGRTAGSTPFVGPAPLEIA